MKLDFITRLPYYRTALIVYNQGHDQPASILPFQATFLQEEILYFISMLTQVPFLTPGNLII